MANPVNIKMPLKKGSKGPFETNDSTIDAIRDDLKVLLLTNHGERPIHFDYGANIRALLFEPMVDPQGLIEDSVRAAVEKWMPFVRVDNVIIKTSANEPQLKLNELNIKLEFSVGNLQGVLDLGIKV